MPVGRLLSDYARSHCQLQSVLDKGGAYRPFLSTWIRKVGRTIPPLLAAKRWLDSRLAARRHHAPSGMTRPPVQAKVEVLGLRPGEWVTVRSTGDIEASLDARGCLGRTRFLKGMWKFSGRRFQVHKRIENVVDYRTGHMWKVRDTVVLAGVYCERDPSEDKRCDQTCFYFWKEAWLERCDAPPEASAVPSAGSRCP